MIKQLSIILVVVLLIEMNPRAIISACHEACWTEWFDRDDPTGTGDHEKLSSLRDEHPGEICENPLQIEVETLSGQTVSETGDVIEVSDTITGFICKNSDQSSSSMCQDYHVRFRCPYSFCGSHQCWTGWFNGDNPDGLGDWELLTGLHLAYPDMICNDPLQIEVQTSSGQSVAGTGDVIAVSDTTTGFMCMNNDQTSGMCQDYRVRFLCPWDFSSDLVYWTDWYDRDDPPGGDRERLIELKQEFPGEICDNPLYIEVVTTDTETPFDSTGQTAFVNSPAEGFICRNQDQGGDQCLDYKVRFGCPCPHWFH